ncbi:permease [Bacillus mesophilum]|uniref:permease n=1 Tax=Bacillus mesophilum TaxID=1071718 RepID=UPI0013755EFC|nr:permease [Bacillus mesophilum]
MGQILAGRKFYYNELQLPGCFQAIGQPVLLSVLKELYMGLLNQLKNLTVYLVFLFFIYFFLFGNEEILNLLGLGLQEEWTRVFDVFIGILLEAIPFILIGVFISSIIQVFFKEEQIKKLIPKKPLPAFLAAITIAIITPVCECAIIPVVRKLIQKGVPIHAGVTILIGAPILNFIVFGSTYYAFQDDPFIYFGRIVICLLTAAIVSFIIYIYFSKENILKNQKSDFQSLDIPQNVRGDSKLKGILHHSANEFFIVGKYFMVGALLASVAQVFISETAMLNATQNTIIGTAFMMGLAFVLSLCSEADAFVAASFSSMVPSESLLAFLVFGPIIDLKNTLVMLSSFKLRFVLLFTIAVVIVVMMLSIGSGIYLRGNGLIP